MITDEIYSKLKGNSYYRLYKSYLYIAQFDELMMQMLILISEDGDSFEPGYLYLIRTLRDRTGYGLKDLNEFGNLLRWLGVIDTEKSFITDYIYIINSIKDIVYMVDNRMDVRIYSRFLKLNKIKSNIIDKL